MKKRIPALALAFALVLLALLAVRAAERAAEERNVLELAVISDVHYQSPERISAAGFAAMKEASATENRLMLESEGILDQLLTDLRTSKRKPDIVLFCGDMTCNGEAYNARAVADRLQEAEKALGADFYVINGNHDINCSYAADFSGEIVQNTQRILPDGGENAASFREIFREMGYDGESVYFGAVPGPESRATGALSYARRIADGVTLLALDSCTYSADVNARFEDAQKTGGEFSRELLDWAAAQAREATARGDLVIAVCHHSVIPHYDWAKDGTSSLSCSAEDAGPDTMFLNVFYENFILNNWREAATVLADAGVTVIFTGHTHVNDIAKYTTESGNTLYDVGSGSLCVHPCAYHRVRLIRHGEGDRQTWSFDVRSVPVRRARWTDPVTGESCGTEDLQAYSAGYNVLSAHVIGCMTDERIREVYHDIAVYQSEEYGDGAEGWVREKLALPRTVTWLEALERAAARYDGKSGAVSVLLMNVSYRIAYRAEEHRLAVTLRYGAREDRTDVVTFDLERLPGVIDELLARLDEEVRTGDVRDTNYADQDTELQTELFALIEAAAERLLSDSLTALPDGRRAEREDQATLETMLNAAYQGYLRGSERETWKELEERRLVWKRLLTGRSVTHAVENAVEALIDGLTAEDEAPPLYPALYALIDRPLDGFCTVTPESGYTNTLLLPYNGFRSLPNVLKATRYAAAMLITDELLRPLTDQMELALEGLTVEHSIPEDAAWSFRCVRFDPGAGTVSPARTVTVEDGMTAIPLPEPRSAGGERFLGWSTSPTGGTLYPAGERIRAERELILYAQWGNP